MSQIDEYLEVAQIKIFSKPPFKGLLHLKGLKLFFKNNKFSRLSCFCEMWSKQDFHKCSILQTCTHCDGQKYEVPNFFKLKSE